MSLGGTAQFVPQFVDITLISRERIFRHVTIYEGTVLAVEMEILAPRPPVPGLLEAPRARWALEPGACASGQD
eukprot:1151858-Rhodomonas_salina.2